MRIMMGIIATKSLEIRLLVATVAIHISYQGFIIEDVDKGFSICSEIFSNSTMRYL